MSDQLSCPPSGKWKGTNSTQQGCKYRPRTKPTLVGAKRKQFRRAKWNMCGQLYFCCLLFMSMLWRLFCTIYGASLIFCLRQTCLESSMVTASQLMLCPSVAGCSATADCCCLGVAHVCCSQIMRLQSISPRVGVLLKQTWCTLSWYIGHEFLPQSYCLSFSHQLSCVRGWVQLSQMGWWLVPIVLALAVWWTTRVLMVTMSKMKNKMWPSVHWHVETTANGTLLCRIALVRTYLSWFLISFLYSLCMILITFLKSCLPQEQTFCTHHIQINHLVWIYANIDPCLQSLKSHSRLIWMVFLCCLCWSLSLCLKLSRVLNWALCCPTDTSREVLQEHLAQRYHSIATGAFSLLDWKQPTRCTTSSVDCMANGMARHQPAVVSGRMSHQWKHVDKKIDAEWGNEKRWMERLT